MKKFLYIAATALLLSSCSEDYKTWVEPQNGTQEAEVSFGKGIVSPVDVIDYAEVTEERVKVCDMTCPAVSDTTYYPECIITINGEDFALAVDGTMDAQELKDHVISLYGKAPEIRVLDAQVQWLMTNGKTVTKFMSDPFEIKVVLEPVAVPDLWYLVGSCIGNGSWGNDPANIGTALIPMYTEAEDFSVLTYVGYFPAGQGFKLIHKPGSWDEQWGMKDGAFVKNDGGSDNIAVAADGYYQVTYDTNTQTLTVEPYTEPVVVYDRITLPNDPEWIVTGNRMDPMSTVVENHDWIKVMTYETDTEAKFFNGKWGGINWGASTFPVGVGVKSGNEEPDNIPVVAGTYTVVFNDILGRYYFIAE